MSFYKNDHTWMDYRLILSNLKFVDLQFFVTLDIDVKCHVNLGFFQRWPQGKKCFLTYHWSISSLKAKITQFARSFRIMTCLPILKFGFLPYYRFSPYSVRIRDKNESEKTLYLDIFHSVCYFCRNNQNNQSLQNCLEEAL